MISAVISSAFPALRAAAVAPLSSGVARPNFSATVDLCAALNADNLPLPYLAAQLVSVVEDLTIYSLTAVLGTVCTPALIDLAVAVLSAIRTNSTAEDETSLLLYDPAGTPPAGLATVYRLAAETYQGGVPPTDLARGLAYAYEAAGRPLDATTLMQALNAAYIPPISLADAVQAVRVSLDASVMQAMAALAATFTGPPPIVAGQCAAAIAIGYGVHPDEAAFVGAALISVFGVGRCPTATAALALALAQGGFAANSVLAVLPGLMTGWTSQCEATVTDVYTHPEWQTAYTVWTESGQQISTLASELRQRYRLLPDRLVEVMAGACVLVTPGAAAWPLATGLRAVGIGYPQALSTLIAFFTAMWTSADTEQVQQAYGGTQADRDEDRLPSERVLAKGRRVCPRPVVWHDSVTTAVPAGIRTR